MKFILLFCLFCLHLGSVALASESDDATSDDGTAVDEDKLELAVCVGLGECTPDDSSGCSGFCKTASMSQTCEIGNSVCTAEEVDIECAVGFDFSDVVPGMKLEPEDGPFKYILTVQSDGSGDATVDMEVFLPGTETAMTVDTEELDSGESAFCFPLKEMPLGAGGLSVCLVLNATLTASDSAAYLTDVQVNMAVGFVIQVPLFDDIFLMAAEGFETKATVCFEAGKILSSPIFWVVVLSASFLCGLVAWGWRKYQQKTGGGGDSGVSTKA